MNSSDDFLKAKILFKLARRRNWGASHTAFDNLKKGFHPKEQGNIFKLSKELIKENFLLSKPTSYGLQVSLNPEKAQEIKQKIRELLGVQLE